MVRMSCLLGSPMVNRKRGAASPAKREERLPPLGEGRRRGGRAAHDGRGSPSLRPCPQPGRTRRSVEALLRGDAGPAH